MKPIALDDRGMAYVQLHIAPLDGRKMETHDFLLDTGATTTRVFPKVF